MITPAITVLSAVEGLEVATRCFKPFVRPHFGRDSGAAVFPAATRHRPDRQHVWAGHGDVVPRPGRARAARASVQAPGILPALNPHHAIHFLFENRRQSFVVLGAVFLAVTGAEALYADMGHFGATPIRKAWFAVVVPGTDAELLRPGRVAPAGCDPGGEESLLSAGALLGGATGWWGWPPWRR